jgi:hypothetical protein
MLARQYLPNGIDLSGLSALLPQLPPSREATVSQAVETYAQTGDTAQARAILAGWGDAEVASQLASMESNAADAAARLKIAKLRQALNLPQVEPSLGDLLVSQQMIWITSGLAALPLLAAVVLSVIPAIRQVIVTSARQARANARARRGQAAVVQVVEEVVEDVPGEGMTPEQEAEAQAAAQAEAQAVAVKAKAEKPAETKTESATGDPLGGEQASPAIQGILSDVFGDDTQTTRRTVLLQGLSDMPVEQLLAACRQVADGLRMSRQMAGRRAAPPAAM